MIRLLKPILFAAGLVPFAQLLYRYYSDDLGANPIDTITRFTGSWALLILLTSLAITPLRRITGWNELIKLRRMIGLFAFFYAFLHFCTYVVLDHFFDFPAIGKDVVKRPYVTVGFTALVILTALAATSTAGMIRRLGKRWQQLHYLVYAAAIAGVLHFLWLVKSDITRPAKYGIALALLLGYRLLIKWSPRFATRLTFKSAAAPSR
jgi:methionine sulfoxide reductase heme-binding subunit